MAIDVTTGLGGNNLVGDGTTDNTAKLNAAMAAATLPVSWYWPAGTYVLKSQPNAIPTGFTWYGDGKDVTIINGTRVTFLSDAVLTCAGSTALTLRDMTITTPDVANNCDQCLVVSGATGIVLERIKFSNAFDSCIRAASPASVNATQCEFTNVHQGVSASFVSGALQNSTFIACRFHDNNTASVNTQHAVYLNGGTSATTTPINVTLNGCTFINNNGGAAVSLKGVPGSYFAQALAVVNCTFAPGASESFCIVSENIQGLVVAGNTFYCPGPNNAILLFGANVGFSIVGNTMQNSGLGGSSGTTFATLVSDGGFAYNSGVIADNVVTQPYQTFIFSAGISISSGNYVKIHGNHFEGLYADVILNGTGDTANIEIYDNDFLILPGWTDTSTGGRGYFGQAHFTRGVGIDGPVTGVVIGQNRIVGKNANVQLVQFNYVGAATNIRFNDQNGFVIP